MCHSVTIAAIMTSVPAGEAISRDMRSALFSELRDKGLLTSVKAQLRGKVIQELQSLAVRPPTRETGTQRCSRLCVSVLAEFLERTGMEYTLSVLLIEEGSGREGLMGRGEIKGILGTDVRGEETVLTYLVEEMVRDRGIKKR